MRRFWQVMFWLALMWSTAVLAETGVRVSLIKTAEGETRDALSWSGGSWLSSVKLNHIAVLVSHPGKGDWLLDSGLGVQMPAQVEADMPWWAGSFLKVSGLNPARTQLGERSIKGIVLTHAHWDHASGLVDFPGVPVWVRAEEQALISTGKPPVIFPSQFPSSLNWHLWQADMKPALGFEQSYDLFEDGSVMLLPMPGHTPGSTAILVRLESGRRLLFVGDTIWRAAQIEGEGAEKYWFARNLVDADRAAVKRWIDRLVQLRRTEPDLLIVPSHDAGVQDTLGYWPAWVQ